MPHSNTSRGTNTSIHISTPSDDINQTGAVISFGLSSKNVPSDHSDSPQVNFIPDLKRQSYATNLMTKSDTLSTSLRSESMAMAMAISTSLRPESAHARVSVASGSAMAKSRIAIRSVELFENPTARVRTAARSGPNDRRLSSEPEIEESDTPFTSLSNILPEDHPLFHHMNELFSVFGELTVAINEMKFRSDYDHTLTSDAQCQLARMSETIEAMNQIHARMNGI